MIAKILVCLAAGARMAAKFANKAPAKTLNRAIGIVLSVLGIAMVTVKYF